MKKLSIWLGILSISWLGWTPGSAHALPAKPEDELKAALIFAFARFGEWPRGEGADPPALIIGVMGRPDLETVLERTVAGKRVAGRPVEVRKVNNPPEAAGCHLLFIGLTDGARERETLRQLRDMRVLTLGDSVHFIENGGAISLFQQDGRMSFEVNLSAVSRAGAAISAKLLRLGQRVRRPEKMIRMGAAR